MTDVEDSCSLFFFLAGGYCHKKREFNIKIKIRSRERGSGILLLG